MGAISYKAQFDESARFRRLAIGREQKMIELKKDINDILDFSKIEAGKLDMESVEFNLDDVLDNLANLITVKTRKKKIWRSSLPRGRRSHAFWWEIRCDSGRC